MNYTFSVTCLDWINKNELRGNKIDQRKYFTSTEAKWSLWAESYLREIYADEKLKYNAELKFFRYIKRLHILFIKPQNIP